MPKLAGKFALVTGGNSGIGLAAAQLFAAEGAQVAITGRDLNTLASAAEGVGGGAVAIPGDITAAPDRERLFDTIKERFGALDVVFANAGMSGMTPLGSTVEKQFEDLVRINFTSVFFTVQGALPLLRDGASIVLTGSITSVIGAPSNAAYAGSTRTPLWERSRTPQQVAATSARLPQVVPLGRWSEADEIARAVLFLACDDSSYIQGAEIVVDGGLTGLPGGTPAFRG
jgi:NAD(P)-dependent dehydrogenase (short-subunit alcohol dehydrogenase family)